MQDLNINLNEIIDLNKILQAKYPHLEISILPLSQMQKDNESKRIDSEYFKREYLEKKSNLLKIEYVRLENIATIRGGKRLPLGENFLNSNDGIPYIRAEDIKNEFVEFENSPRISEKLHNELSRYQTHYNDVLITIVGSIGDVGIVKFNLKKCNLTENCIKLTNLVNINAETLFTFFKSSWGQFQINRETVGTIQPKLAIERIRNFLIPIFPQNFQLEIENLVKDSHKALENSKDLYKEAEKILYETLGLDPIDPIASLYNTTKTQANTLTEKIKTANPSLKAINFTIRSLKESYLATGRLDAEYYQEKYDLIESKIKEFSYKKLGDLVNIKKSIEPGSEAYQSEGIEFVRVINLSKFGISKSNIYLNKQEFADKLNELIPKKETILLSKDGSIGTSYCLEDDLECITSGAILHLQVKDKNEILPQVLNLILNSIVGQLQAQRDAGGSIIAHWKISEITNILIPKIDKKTQELIALKIQNSFALRKESKDLLTQAKNKIEDAIISASKKL